jgi:uncharacterized DUF497 family protein
LNGVTVIGRKAGRHGLTKEKIEAVFTGSPVIFPGRLSATIELRPYAVGRNSEGPFAVRHKDGADYMRPISARFMHEEEVKEYERQEGSQSIPGTEDGR